MTFLNFNLDQDLLEGLDVMGFTKPTPIQEQAIPLILEQKDLIACAQTGTGKTAAYLLPVINHLIHQERDKINTLILAPTRELAIQIDQQMIGFSYYTPLSSICIYGGGDGSSFDREKVALTKGADVIIATPGRLITHLNLGYVKFDKLQHFVLDEADRMLDMGFYEDIMRIVSYLPKKRQNLLFSATMPPKIRKLAKEILQDPEEINIAMTKPAAGIAQAVFLVYDKQKLPLIEYILKAKPVKRILIFCARKKTVKEIEQDLRKLNFDVGAIHSDLEQSERENVLRSFKNNQTPVLVATDILSRGIDVEDIELVINYDVPNDAEDYVHRIGRTARADTKGAAFTFVSEKEMFQFAQIEKLLEITVTKVKLPAQIGEGPVYNKDTARKKSFKNRGREKR